MCIFFRFLPIFQSFEGLHFDHQITGNQSVTFHPWMACTNTHAHMHTCALGHSSGTVRKNTNMDAPPYDQLRGNFRCGIGGCTALYILFDQYKSAHAWQKKWCYLSTHWCYPWRRYNGNVDCDLVGRKQLRGKKETRTVIEYAPSELHWYCWEALKDWQGVLPWMHLIRCARMKELSMF